MWNRFISRTSVVPMALALRSEEHTSELQSLIDLVCRLLLEKNDKQIDVGPKAMCARVPQGFTEYGHCETAHQAIQIATFFFFNDPASPDIFTLSLPAALPI